MIFNDFDFTTLLTVEKITRLPIAPINHYESFPKGKDGSWFNTASLSTNRITVQCRIIKKNRVEAQEALRVIAGNLFTREPKRLELRDDPLKHNYAIVERTSNFETFLHTGFFEIDFKCPDPYAYGDEITKNLNVEFNYNGTISSNKFNLNFVANKTDELIIKSENNNNEMIKIIFPFNGGEQMFIDFENEQIKINDNNAMKYLSLESDFFSLIPGNNKIIVDGTGTVKFFERYV